jgi:hypothetical protein
MSDSGGVTKVRYDANRARKKFGEYPRPTVLEIFLASLE